MADSSHIHSSLATGLTVSAFPTSVACAFKPSCGLRQLSILKANADQPTISKVLGGRIDLVGAERLFWWLRCLGMRVSIVVAPAENPDDARVAVVPGPQGNESRPQGRPSMD